MNTSSCPAWSLSSVSTAATWSDSATQLHEADGSKLPASDVTAYSSARIPLWMSR